MTTPILADALGPRAKRRVLVASVLSALLLVGLVAVALGRLADSGQLDGDKWAPLTEWLVWKYLLLGLVNTLKAAGLAMAFALVSGSVLALGRLSPRRVLRVASGAYVEFFRGFPLLVLLLFCTFGLRAQDVDISAFEGLVLALSIYNGAVFAEIFRAGVLSLDRGQGEAGAVIGLTDAQVMRLVVLPQALRRMAPAIVNQLVTLLKDTSLGFIILYDELLRRGQLSGGYDRNLLQSLLAVAVLYIAVNFVLSQISRRLEVRQARRYRAKPIEVTGLEDAVPAGA